MPKGSKFAHKRDEWAGMYESGMSFSAIGKAEGVSKATVQNVIKDVVEKRDKSPFDKYALVWVDLYEKQGYSTVDIAEEYKTSPGVVSRILKKHGVVMRIQVEIEKKYLHLVPTWKEQYKSGMSLHEIAATCEASAQTILNYLRDENIEIRDYADSSRIYELDESYFEKIDTQEKAYWLGWFFSSGSTLEHLSSWSIQLTVNSKSKEQLAAFQKVIHTNRPFAKHKGENIYSLRLQSRPLFDQLRALGLENDKVNKQQFPINLSSEYYSSFILGYIEGKGGFYERNVHISGTKFFLDRVAIILKEEIGLEVKVKPVNKENNVHCRIQIWNKEGIKKFSDWLNGDQMK